MARELSLEVEVLGTAEADSAIARLAEGFRKAGDSALVAAEKAEKFRKQYADGSARKQATKELDDLTGATNRTAGATNALTTAVMRYAAPAVVLEAARKTIAWADNIEELAQRTNLSVESVQQLTKVAEKNGSTFQTMAGLIQNVEQRLASHNKKAEEAVKLLGLAPAELLKLDPLERLRAIAKGLADLKDPAQRSALEMALFGRQADGAAVALDALAIGADKAEGALSGDFIRAGAQAQDMLETLTNKALELGKALLLLPAVIGNRLGEMGRDSTLGTMFEMMGLHGSRASKMPGLPGSPGGGFGMPSPLGVPDPFARGGVGGNSYDFLNRALGLPSSRGRATGGARVLPFAPRATSTLGSSMATIFGMANSRGFPAGSLPFVSSMPFLPSGASPISFANGSGLMPTVGMNAPGGGGIGSWLSGHKTQIAGLGLGLLSRFIPQGGRIGAAASMASQGASMGAMFGPWGMGIGAALGGITGLFTGGKAKKNARNAEISQVFEQFKTKDFQELQREAEKFGISMEKALKAKTMKDFGAAVDEVTEKLREMQSIQAQIDDLTERTTVDFDKMNAVVNEFGLDVSKLGPAFQQALTDKESQRIIDAMAIMEKGGADMAGVLDGMADEISTLVQNSIKFGTTIPENMRPWVEQLIKSGKLLDENGNAITDISKVKWGAAMESDMSKLTKKLDELIEKLAQIADGFNRATDAANDLGNANPGGDGGGGSGSDGGYGGGSESGFATGGRAGRDFRRAGHGDLFPALLRRGETVLPPGVHRGGVSLSIGSLSVGGGYGSRADAVEEIGDSVVRYLERRGARLVA